MTKPTTTPHAHSQGPAMEATAPRLRPTTFPWPIFGWEYHEAVLPYGKPWGTVLNRLGLEGWDLVSTIHDESSDSKKYEARLLFKRPRPDLPNDEELRDLGFKNPEVVTPWLDEAREAYVALIAGARAQAEGRVQRGRDDTDTDEPSDDTDEEA